MPRARKGKDDGVRSSSPKKRPSRHGPIAGRFNGFPREAFDFFAQLTLNNQRDWFHAHKEVYERACREPMEQLVAELGANPATTKISRVNRDVRFSRDKSPYRTYIAAGVGGNYISLSPAGVYVGAGLYKPEPPALERFRSAIDRDASGQLLQKIVTSLLRKGYQVDTHERVLSAPRGYSADHPRIALLRMKGIFAGKTFAPEPWLSTRRALQRVRRVVNDTRPLADWLRVHVGGRA
ncbi:MAG: DUF2461 domain-containing protein [Gemmatimonadetes bacterium]|nr:DUF2461 domain-containing protein [Gemmatimonadota bacterium]